MRDRLLVSVCNLISEIPSVHKSSCSETVEVGRNFQAIRKNFVAGTHFSAVLMQTKALASALGLGYLAVVDIRTQPSVRIRTHPSTSYRGEAISMATSGMPHKSRKKKKDPSQTMHTSNEISLPDSKASAQTPAFPLVAFFWPARNNTSQWVILPVVLMIVGLFRWCTGLWGYSGTESYLSQCSFLMLFRFPDSPNARRL